MSRLLLLRHAKAAWAKPGTRDFDRPLDPSGRVDADAIGRLMVARALRPASVLCSTALRARETWAGVAEHVDLDPSQVLLTERLYSADAAGYLDIVRDSGADDMLLVVGHNPMIEDVAFALSGRGGGTVREALSNGFPTAGLAVIELDGGFALTAPGRGRLEDFLSPADA